MHDGDVMFDSHAAGRARALTCDVPRLVYPGGRIQPSDMAPLVLLVDDEPEVVHTLRAVLESAGYRTLAATSFEDGKRLLATTPPPAVLITDIRLGMFNGLQLAVLRPPTTGVIVISGFLDRTLGGGNQTVGRRLHAQAGASGAADRDRRRDGRARRTRDA